MGTTIYGMTAQYWESVVVGFENRLVSRGLTKCQPRGTTARYWISKHSPEVDLEYVTVDLATQMQYSAKKNVGLHVL